MLLSFRDFEQHFRESVLRKGLALFEKNNVELLARKDAQTFQYYVKGHHLVLKRSGERILSCSCSCNSKILCEHLSAVLFYYHDQKFGKSKKPVSNQAKRRARGARAFDDQQKDQFKKWKNDLLTVKALYRRYEKYGKLSETRINQLVAEIQELRMRAVKAADKFYINLAIFSEFATIQNLRFSGQERPLLAELSEIKDQLQAQHRKALSPAERDAWLDALLNALSNNRKLMWDAYFFLTPRYLVSGIQREDIQKLYRRFAHRKLKLGNGTAIEKLKIAILQVEIKLAEMYDTGIVLPIDRRGAEHTIARAELKFCNGETDRGFRILEKDHLRIRTDFEHQYSEFLDYVLIQSNAFKRKDVELKYLLMRMVNSYFISKSQLQRLDELTDKKKRKKLIDDLLKAIRENNRTYSFEKVSALLLHENRISELIGEIKHQHHKFPLLHDLLVQKLPEYLAGDLTLYVSHATEALVEGRYFKVQQAIIEKVKFYADVLAVPDRAFIIRNLLNHFGHEAQISKYIKARMPLPELLVEKAAGKNRFSPQEGKWPHSIH